MIKHGLVNGTGLVPEIDLCGHIESKQESELVLRNVFIYTPFTASNDQDCHYCT